MPARVEKTFGERLKAAREKAKLTQVEAAARANVSQAAWCHYEAGRVDPRLSQAHRLAEAVETTLAEMLK